jgi:short-subunit dehydrogenase
MTNKERFALVTGASSGIGKQLAIELASKGINLLLVSLPHQNLKEISQEISIKYKVLTDFFETDLSEKESPKSVYNWASEYNVYILINNAGLAGTSVFETSDDKYIDDRILVNVRALVLLTRYFIPEMMKMKEAYILNVGGLSAWYSIPFKSLYAATKAFVVNFSRAIRTEYKNTGISVSVLNPNGVRTNEGTLARINSHGKKGKYTTVAVEKVARDAIKGMFKGKFLIIPGILNRALLVISFIIPNSIQQNLLYREFYKEIKILPSKVT